MAGITSLPEPREAAPRNGRATRRTIFAQGSALAILAACGQTSGSGTQTTAPPAIQKASLSGTVHIMANRAFPFHEDVGGEIANSFMAKHPAVTIESEPLAGDAVEKLTAAVAGGAPAELFSIGIHTVQTVAASGAVMSLEEYLKRSTLKKQDIWPTLLNDITYTGKVHGMVYGPDLRIMYISADKYRGAGLDPERPPKTWNELEEAIGKVHRGGQGTDIEHLGFDPFLGSGGIYRWLVPYWQLGGTLTNADGTKVTMNNENAIQALTWLKKVVDRQGGYEKMQAFEKGTHYTRLFMDNKVTHMYATYAERAQAFAKEAPEMKFGFATYPLPANGKKANYGGGHTFPISTGARNPDAAWAFLEHLSSEENNLKFADRYDRIPIRISTTRSERFHKGDPFRKLAAEEMPGRRFVISAPGGAEALSAQGNFVKDIMAGKVSIREGLGQAEQEIQQILDKWRR
ncbi:MAG TPA: extracellular solute-binding protein [Chloroflexota bacterium]|nr:extracellular solute-binding protein [Chloroflexota bacterium]